MKTALNEFSEVLSEVPYFVRNTLISNFIRISNLGHELGEIQIIVAFSRIMNIIMQQI